ncbi:unnamed protein product [Ophioblennius macclurei]
MASGTQFLLLLLLGGPMASKAANLCNISCSTDYRESMNCSCSVPLHTLPALVRVNCSGEDRNVVKSCSITPPQSWCWMLMEELEEVASVGTMCRSDVTWPDGEATEASSWDLADVVKPSAPFDVRVMDAGEFFNITWSHDSSDCLTYNLCIRESIEQLKAPPHCFQLEEQSLQLDQSRPAEGFIVHVQAKLCDTYYLKGPWSEWSSPVLWTMRGDGEINGVRPAWWFISLPIVFFMGVLLLAYRHKPCWQKRLEYITFVPNPDYFFKPLYQNYQGNFKDWVKPVFSEYDYFCVAPNLEELQRRKQPDVLHWNGEDKEAKWSRCSLQHPPQDEEGSSQQANLSIHTVTLSGEEYQDGSLRSLSGGEEQQGEDAEVLAQHRDEGQPDEDFHFHLDEEERASLDSFASGSRCSEDGYPHVDLDTIDSGFGECGSPVANQAEQGTMFSQEPQSNYVKQWMIGAVVQDNHLQETQTLTESGCSP